MNANGTNDGDYSPWNVIKAGEFLLGYLNEYNVLPDPLNLPIASDPNHVLQTVIMPDGVVAPDLGRNGSYLVVRQIAQHVGQLWSYLDRATKDASGASNVYEREKLGAKLIGRWTSGAPVATTPDKDTPARSEENEFLYREIDPDGFRCPSSAHIRRANPRDTLGDDPAEALKLSKRHRLIRRGRSFGPRLTDKLDLTDDHQRGLLFMAVNANIERQFEFVQQTWINGTSFNGLYDERDAIFGNFDGQKAGSMTIPCHPLRRKLHGLGGFVTVLGGAYFFLPSIRAMRYLATIS
jgi:Dyp-type peroxidase family